MRPSGPLPHSERGSQDSHGSPTRRRSPLGGSANEAVYQTLSTSSEAGTERNFQGGVAIAKDESAAETLEGVSNNLPVPLTSFIERPTMTDEVAALLLERRLVTLIGAPGAGKTRQALHVATKVAHLYTDGVWLVDLARASEPDEVPGAVALALSIRERPHEAITNTVATYLTNRVVLLVLDNCEHLLEACGDLVCTLLSASRRLTVLTTSREALGIIGERSGWSHPWPHRAQTTIARSKQRMPYGYSWNAYREVYSSTATSLH